MITMTIEEIFAEGLANEVPVTKEALDAMVAERESKGWKLDDIPQHYKIGERTLMGGFYDMPGVFNVRRFPESHLRKINIEYQFVRFTETVPPMPVFEKAKDREARELAAQEQAEE